MITKLMFDNSKITIIVIYFLFSVTAHWSMNVGARLT